MSMKDRDDRACDVTATGLEGLSAGAVHFDVNGKWGGKRAVVAHFGEEPHQESMLYMLIGSYWKVGDWEMGGSGPTRWTVAKLLAWALQTGVDPANLYDAITDAIASETGLATEPIT